jgi:fatty acid-binding protein DegV
MRDGKLMLAGVARTRAKAINRLYDFVEDFPHVSEIAVSYTTTGEEAEALAERIKSSYPDIPLYLTRLGPVLGTHAGPGAMGVAVRESGNK